jgi:hypothetical protein
MTEGDAVVFVPEVEELPVELAPDPESEPPKVSTLSESPSSDTDQAFCPPPVHM